MPSFRDGNETLLASVLYQHLGNTYSEILINILINPLDTLDKIFNAPRIGSFVMFLIPLMFTPLFEITVLISIPNLMMTFLVSLLHIVTLFCIIYHHLFCFFLRWDIRYL